MHTAQVSAYYAWEEHEHQSEPDGKQKNQGSSVEHKQQRRRRQQRGELRDRESKQGQQQEGRPQHVPHAAAVAPEPLLGGTSGLPVTLPLQPPTFGGTMAVPASITPTSLSLLGGDTASTEIPTDVVVETMEQRDANMIQSFMDTTGSNETTAKAYLSRAFWDVNAAVNEFFSLQDFEDGSDI